MFLLALLTDFGIDRSVAYENVALGKPTEQSSQYYVYNSRFAVDGINETEISQYKCTHTYKDNRAWWTVDLQRDFNIHSLMVLNRKGNCVEGKCSNRLSRFEVHVSEDKDFDRYEKLCYKNNDSSPPLAIDAPCTSPQCGRYVTVSLLVGYLTLCEVEIYGEPLVANSSCSKISSTEAGFSSTVPLSTSLSVESTSPLSTLSSKPETVRTTFTFYNTDIIMGTMEQTSSVSGQNKCLCGRKYSRMFNSDLSMITILTDMQINRSNISRIRSRYECLSDARVSARVSGWIGLFLLLFISVGIVLSDVPKMYFDVTRSNF